MTEIERSAERDAAIVAMLPHVTTLGWTRSALCAGLATLGEPSAAAQWLFTGSLDMIEAYIDYADRRMAHDAAELAETRLSARVRALIALRLRAAAPERDAVRRAASVLAFPTSARVAARTLARTVDAIWHAAGDRSADMSWYTKRGILAAVYAPTLLNWLRLDDLSDPDDAQALDFLDRRLAGVARLGKLRGRISAAACFSLPRRQRPVAPG